MLFQLNLKFLYCIHFLSTRSSDRRCYQEYSWGGGEEGGGGGGGGLWWSIAEWRILDYTTQTRFWLMENDTSYTNGELVSTVGTCCFMVPHYTEQETEVNSTWCGPRGWCPARFQLGTGPLDSHFTSADTGAASSRRVGGWSRWTPSSGCRPPPRAQLVQQSRAATRWIHVRLNPPETHVKVRTDSNMDSTISGDVTHHVSLYLSL